MSTIDKLQNLHVLMLKKSHNKLLTLIFKSFYATLSVTSSARRGRMHLFDRGGLYAKGACALHAAMTIRRLIMPFTDLATRN